MKQERIEYALLTGVILIMFFVSSEKFLFFLFLIMVSLPISGFLSVKRMKNHIGVTVKAKESVRKDEQIEYCFQIHTDRRLTMLRGAQIHVSLFSVLVNEIETQDLLLEFDGEHLDYTWKTKAEDCGEMRLRIEKAELVDLFGLVKEEITSLKGTVTLVYPHWINTDLVFYGRSSGYSENTGIPENRHGNDRNEVLNYRDYMIGDDIRNIHWKLSARSEELIVREAANTNHFDVLLLIDIGQFKNAEELSKNEINTSVALFRSLAEKMNEYRIPFCLGSVTESGIRLAEVNGRNVPERILGEWLRYSIPYECGKGLSFFDMNHYESVFSRLIYISGGGKMENISHINGKISAMILDVEENVEAVHTTVSGSFSIMQIPATLDRDAVIRIVC